MQEAEMVGSLAEKCLDSLCIGPTVSPQKLLRSITIMLTERQKENCRAFETYSLRSMTRWRIYVSLAQGQ